MPLRRLVPVALAFVAVGLTIGIFTLVRSRGAPSPQSTEVVRPRARQIILITIDALRADCLACYGHPTMLTPNLSGLSRDAILFEQAVAPSPWTRPSVASLHTGLPPLAHGTTAQEIEVEAVLPDAVRTLAEHMRASGYKTAGMGYNAFIAFSPNINRGFQEYAFFPIQVANSDGKFIPVENSVGGLKIHGASRSEMQAAMDRLGTTPVLTQLAVQWLTDHAQDDFFLWIHYFNPHAPYVPPRDYFSGRTMPLMMAEGDYGTWALKLNGVAEEFLKRERKVARGTATPDEQETCKQLRKMLEERKPALQRLYEAEVEFVDGAIGSLVQSLRQLGLYEDSLLVVTSDHGEEFWDHGGLEHGHTLKQELLRVPLLIKPPRHRGAVRIRERVSIESILPTILDLCSIPRPAGPGFQPSLTSTWEGPRSRAPAPALFAEGILYGKPKGAVFFGDMKFIREYATGEEQLHNLATDPGETRSLVDDAPAALAEGRRLLEKRNLEIRALRKSIWSGGVRTTEPNEAARKVLRSHGYIK